MKQKNTTTIQSLQVGMSIIDVLAISESPLKLTEIQERTGITKSNLYKYLNTFTDLGMLFKDKDQGTYQLGSKLIEYGMAALGQEDVIARVLPYLREISQTLDCTVLLSTWTYNGPVILKIWNSKQAFNIGAQLGSLLPPNSSTGKIFHTFLDEGMTNEWVKEMGKEGKITMEAELETIRIHKISFAKEPLISFISSTSIPVFNFNNELLAAVTIVGFLQEIPVVIEDDKSVYLMEKSKEISSLFGYTENNK